MNFNMLKSKLTDTIESAVSDAAEKCGAFITKGNYEWLEFLNEGVHPEFADNNIESLVTVDEVKVSNTAVDLAMVKIPYVQLLPWSYTFERRLLDTNKELSKRVDEIKKELNDNYYAQKESENKIVDETFILFKNSLFTITLKLETSGRGVTCWLQLHCSIPRKLISFIPKESIESKHNTKFFSSFFKSVFDNDTVIPLFDLSSDIEYNSNYKGVTILKNGNLFYIPPDLSKVDRRKEFLLNPTKNTIVYYDGKAQTMYFTHGNDIDSINYSGCAKPSLEFINSLFNNSLNNLFLHSILSIDHSKSFDLSEPSKNFLIENKEVLLRDANKDKIKDILLEIKEHFAKPEIKISSIPTNYITAIAKVQILLENLNKIEVISEKIVKRRSGFNEATKEDTPAIPNLREDLYLLSHQALALAKVNNANETAIFDIGTGGGKCAEGWCCVPTSKGLLTLKEAWNNSEIYVDTQGFRKTDFDTFTTEGIYKATNTYKTKGKVNRLIFSDGDFFGGLPEHKLHVLTNHTLSFKRLDEISVGDYLPKSFDTQLYNSEIPTINLPNCNVQLTTDFAELLGFFVSEGYIPATNPHCSITVKHDKFKDYIVSLSESFFGYNIFSVNKDRNGLNVLKVTDKSIVDLIKSIITPGLSANRNIPYIIRIAPKLYQCHFLKALFEGDGSIYKESKHSNRWTIEYCSISRMLSLQIKWMLENMGIFSTIYWGTTYKTYFNGEKIKRVYKLYIEHNYFNTYSDLVGFCSKKKRSRLESCINHFNWLDTEARQNTNNKACGLINKVPAGDLVNSILEDIDTIAKTVYYTIEVSQKTHTKKSFRTFNYSLSYLLRDKLITIKDNLVSKYSISSLLDIIDTCPVELKHKLLNNKKLVKKLGVLTKLSSYIWVKVEDNYKYKSVDCYDLSVPGPHNYAINGVMGHNTISILSDALILMSKGMKRPLIVMPNSLVGQWVGEINYFTNHSVNVICITTETVNSWGLDRLKATIDSAPPNSVFLTTYKWLSLNGSEEEGFPNVDWIKDNLSPEYVALDESHFIKNLETAAGKSLMELRSVDNRRIATGTLISNNPDDMVGQVAFLDPKIIGNMEEFCAKYALSTNGYGKPTAYRSDARRLMARDLSQGSYYLKFSEKHWAGSLPHIEYNKYIVNQSQKQLAVYKMIVDQIMDEIEKDPMLRRAWEAFINSNDDSGISASLLGKMAKLEMFLSSPDSNEFGDFALLDSDKISCKMNQIDELIEQSLNKNQKVIVAVHYKKSARHFYENSKFKEHAVYYEASLPANIVKFKTDPDVKILFAVIQCFDGDTYVMVDHNRAMMIKDIYENDDITELLAYDLDKKKIVTRKIRAKSRQDATNDTFYNLSIKKPGRSGRFTVKVTGNHQVWSHTRKEYVKVKELNVGEQVVYYNGDFKYYTSCQECNEIFESNTDSWNKHYSIHREGVSFEDKFGKKEGKRIKEQIRSSVKLAGVKHPVTGISYEDYYGPEVAAQLKLKSSEFHSRPWDEKFGVETSNRMRKNASKRLKGVSDIERLGEEQALLKSKDMSERLSKRQSGVSWDDLLGVEKSQERKDKLRLRIAKNGKKAWVQPNIPEQNVINLDVDNLYFTGNGSYYVNLGPFTPRKECDGCHRLKCGIKKTKNWIKNPDFVWIDNANCGKCSSHRTKSTCMFRSDKRACKMFSPRQDVKVDGVVELNGDFWHCDREIQNFTRLYKKKGINILNIPSEYCYDNNLTDIKGRLEAFVNNHITEVVDIRKSCIERDYKYTFDVEDTHNYFVVARKERSNSPEDGIPFLVSNSISEGHNLQMANRIIIADVDWTPGKLKQLMARIYRPHIKIVNGKLINLNAGKTVFIDTILANNSADTIKYCLQTYKKIYNSNIMEDCPIELNSRPTINIETLSSTFEEIGGPAILEKDNEFNAWFLEEIEIEKAKGYSDPIPVKHAKSLGNEKIIVPWVNGMPLPILNDSEIPLLDYMENLETYDENDYTKSKEDLIGLTVRGESGESKIIKVLKKSVVITNSDNEELRVHPKMLILISDENRLEIDLAIYNDYYSLVAERGDTDSNELKKFGFVWNGKYKYFEVTSKQAGLRKLKEIESKYTIPKSNRTNIVNMLDEVVKGIYEADSSDTKNFFKVKHTKAENNVLKLYPLIEDGIMYLVYDVATNSANLSGFDTADGYYYKFFERKTDINKTLKLISEEYEISNKEELIQIALDDFKIKLKF